MTLNSPFVQWLLKFGLSKGGIIITAVVTWLITNLGLRAFVSAEDLQTIEQGLNAGGMALIAGLYAWLSSRQKAGVKVLQEQLNNSDLPSKLVKVDGVAGNETVKAAAQVTGVSVAKAVEAVEANAANP